MAECPFKIGDRVVGIKSRSIADIVGKCGVVIYIWDSHIGVEFDERVFDKKGHEVGHDLGGKIKSRRGRLVLEDEIKLCEPETPKKPKKPKRLRKPKGVFTFDELVNTDKYVPELTRINISKCIIASATYPYAILDEDGQLWFYKEPPKNTAYFITAEVKSM